MSFHSTPANEQTPIQINISPERSYPGKGIGYDWRCVVAEIEAAGLDSEFAHFSSLPVQ